MIDKIIYISLLNFFRKKKALSFPERIPVVSIVIPKVIVVMGVLRLYVGEDGYVEYKSITDMVIPCLFLILLVISFIYSEGFMSKEQKTAQEVEQALRETPTKWKILIGIYLATIILFACIVYCIV